MRILFCNFHEGHGGGQDTYLLSLIKALKTKHRVAIACPSSARLYSALESEIACFAINYKAIFRHGCLGFKQLPTFKRWIAKHNFDIIHVNGSAEHRTLLLIYPFLKHRPKLILTKHNALRIKWGALLRMQHFTDAIIAVSQSTRLHLGQAGVNASLIRTIPNGIDTEFYQPISNKQKISLRQQYHLNSDDFIFVSNAGTAECKNWPMLLAAIAALPCALKSKIKVIIAGKQPKQEQLKIVNKLSLGEHVMFTGLLTDTRAWMTLGDVGFVLSNTQETISFACREMMAMGLPVIVSNYGGLPENISADRDGWIVPTNNISALTRCLITILTQANLAQMAKRAREKAVKNFDKQSFIDATLTLYQDLINSSPL
jgi:L-malate glycosyltransferase